jgi:hypothetical protein
LGPREVLVRREWAGRGAARMPKVRAVADVVVGAVVRRVDQAARAVGRLGG